MFLKYVDTDLELQEKDFSVPDFIKSGEPNSTEKAPVITAAPTTESSPVKTET